MPLRRALTALLVPLLAASVGAAWNASLALSGRAQVSLAQIHPLRSQAATPGNTIVSQNWAGYVLPSYATGTSYTSASAEWVVPAVSLPQGASQAASSSWVGIGGFCLDALCSSVDTTLIQLGTEQDAQADATSYYAWYETLPGPARTIHGFAVHPGDEIAASLAATPSQGAPQVWTLSLTDRTTGQTWSTTVRYDSSLASAEWIEEAPSAGSLLPLADFGRVPFAPLGTDGTPADLRAAVPIVMEDPSGGSASVSRPDQNQDGFAVCYGTATCSPPQN